MSKRLTPVSVCSFDSNRPQHDTTQALITHPAEQGDLAGLDHVDGEGVVEVGGGHVEDHQLHAEGGRVLDGHQPGHVVPEGGLQGGAGLDGLLAALDQVGDVALWVCRCWYLGVECVLDRLSR